MSVELLILTLFTMIVVMASVNYYQRIWNPILLFTIMLYLGDILARRNVDSEEFNSATIWILIGEFFFVSFFFTTQYIFNKKIRKEKSTILYNNIFVEKMLNVNMAVSTLNFLVGLYAVMQVSPSFLDIFTNSTYVRYLYLQRNSSMLISVCGIFLSLNFFVTLCFFPIAMQNKIKNVLPKFLFVLIIRLLSSLITMSKEGFLIDVIYFISVYMLGVRNKKEEHKFYIKYGTGFGIMIIALIVVISFQRNYVVNGRYSNYLEAILGTISEYTSVTIEAFGKLISNNSLAFTKGTLCFRPFINILSYLGIGEHVSIVQDVVTDITDVNVYTAFGNMYRDFSFGGIICLSAFFGSFFGMLYNVNCGYNISNMVIDSIVTMTMFFFYYDLKIIQTIYLFVMLYALIFEYVVRKVLYINYNLEKDELFQV